ncbi:MAG: hypothetical protein U1E05_07590, partial [Patescibacteria group bacterium]|nr:hypothetical protein [Patescibacteria group bacterium]
MNRNCQLRCLKVLPVLAVSLLLPCGTARALDLRIDFAANSSTGNPGGNWNTLSSPSATVNGLIDFSTGAASGVNLTFTQPLNGPGNVNAGQWSGTPAYPSWIDSKATNDYFFIQANAGNPNPRGLITFSGLDPNASYRVEVLGSRTNQNSVLQADYKVQNVFSRNGSQGYDAYVDGYTNHKVMTWRDVRAENGQIAMTMDGVGSSLAGYLSAMQIFEEQRLLIDLGIPARTTPGNWNNIASDKSAGGTEGPGHMILGAVDAAGVETSVKVNVLAPFQAHNANGMGTAQSGYPHEARSDSLATGAAFPKATVQL